MAPDVFRLFHAIGATDKLVTFNPTTLAVSALITLPITNTVGIVTSEYNTSIPNENGCTSMAGGVFQVRYSNDGGENYSAWRDFAPPATGRFGQQFVARRLGQCRHRIWEFRDTSDVAQDVLAAQMIVEGG